MLVLSRRAALLGAAAATVPRFATARPPNTPEGWYDYVQRTGERAGPRAVIGDDSPPSAVRRIDDEVNAIIRHRAATDRHIDLGTFRDDGNDCTAGALLKRRRLVARGYPWGTMPLAIGLDLRGSWHCVLLLRGARHIYKLDTQHPPRTGPQLARWLLTGDRPWYVEPEEGWYWPRLRGSDLP